MPYQSVTLASFRERLTAKWEGLRFWTDPEATFAINESLRVWNLLTGRFKRRIVYTTVANEVWVALPGTMVYSMRIEFNGIPLDLSALGDLDNGRPGWEAERTTDGGSVPTRPSLWTPAGLTRFAIWPADAAGQNSLLIDGVRVTPVLTIDGDFVDLGNDELDALLGYALHVSAFKHGGARFAATMSLYKQFLIAAADQNNRLKTSAFFRREMGLDVNRGLRPVRLADVGA